MLNPNAKKDKNIERRSKIMPILYIVLINRKFVLQHVVFIFENIRQLTIKHRFRSENCLDKQMFEIFQRNEQNVWFN